MPRWLTIEPMNEEILRLLIGLYIQTSQFSAALRLYKRFTRVLRVELGLDPSPETRAIYKQLLSLQNSKI